MIGENVQALRARIAEAATRAGRAPQSVRLLAVSKTQPAAAVEEAARAGLAAFGENYVQEALAKLDALAALKLEWHLIGPLQGNKARLVAERFDWVQTVDRERIARRLSDARPEARGPLDVLVQINVSGEASKSGVAPADAPSLARAVAAMPRLRLRGLMAIPEPTEDAALQRARFREVRAIYERLNAEGLALDTLSLGMSGDLEAAILEGSTMIRVGTAIFGQRAPARPAASPER